MEEVRTSIEKIFDTFEANHKDVSTGKRLDYSFLNNSNAGKWMTWLDCISNGILIIIIIFCDVLVPRM